MKKTIIIAVLTLFLIILAFGIFSSYTYAISIDDLKGNGATTGSIKNAGNKMITYIAVTGSIVSVIALIFLGIKYMLGSVEEKAIYKKSLMPYIIGAVFVFGASTIAGVMYGFFK